MNALFPLDNWAHWNIDLLPPGSYELDVPGAMLESPRSLSGRRRVADLSGGGFWSVAIDGVPIQTHDAMLAWNRIAKVLSSGGIVILPILTGIMAPVPLNRSAQDRNLWDEIDGIAFSDGALFSDGSGFVQSSVSARLAGDHVIGAGTVTFDLVNAQPLRGGETFSLFSPVQGFRAHRMDDWDAMTTIDAATTRYTAAIQPPLSDDFADGSIVDFHHPRSMMQLAPNERMPLAPGTGDWWTFKGSVKLVEAV